MSITKRWLAVILTIFTLFSDCCSLCVFATENTTMAKTSVSENNAVSDKIPDDSMPYIQSEPADPTETYPIQDENTASETKLELPALHIGQIPKSEALPVPDDLEFTYDLPISFEASECLLLFTNYSIDETLETEKGTLVWSILCGEKGLAAGSAILLDEEDD